MTDKHRILVISHIPELISQLQVMADHYPVSIEVMQGSFEALQILRQKPAKMVIVEFDIPLISAEEIIGLVHKAKPETPILVVADSLTDEEKQSVVSAGAFDYIERPIEQKTLETTIRNLLSSRNVFFHVKELRERLKKEYGLENVIGDCEPMWKVFRSLGNIADSDVTVFLQGESGTGKEVLARAVHSNSKRKKKPLITINCAAIPENLLESELFGHEKGSFSGAVSQRIGKFEHADGGTMFLDEIGEMSLVLQAKILRVLEEQEFERVGGNKSVKVDTRIISATNKNLDVEVKEGRFREDLYYRIKVYPIDLPPLRARVGDIPLLTLHFLDILSKKNNREVMSISTNALELLTHYQWPGNIRELENVLERALLNCPGKMLHVEDFDLETPVVSSADVTIEQKQETVLIPEARTIKPLKEIEKNAIVEALELNQGNISESARQLGIGRATLHRKIKEYNISQFRAENIHTNKNL